MRALAALILALPLAALAEDVAPTPAPAPAPTWSLGAGVSVFSSSLISGAPFPSSIVYASNPPTPALGATASLERRMGDRTWLTVGFDGSVDHIHNDVAPGAYGYASLDERRLSIAAGIRRAFSAPGAPVELSALATLGAGLGSLDERFVTPTTEWTGSSLTWTVGANLGVAVDRELTSGVSLRVATPLVGVSWWETDSRITGSSTRHGSSFGAGVTLAPRLELRVAF